jgi:hypothetical protein
MNQETCTIQIGKETRSGTFPRAPIRFKLAEARRNALGYTAADTEAIRQMEDGDDPIEPSMPGDGLALAYVYFAALGMCWPEEITPTLRQCRHDVVEYGEICYEHFRTKHPGGMAAARDAGSELLDEMLQAVTATLTEDIKLEAGFTQGSGESSTSE